MIDIKITVILAVILGLFLYTLGFYELYDIVMTELEKRSSDTEKFINNFSIYEFILSTAFFLLTLYLAFIISEAWECYF